jgi:hypothetical protein
MLGARIAKKPGPRGKTARGMTDDRCREQEEVGSGDPVQSSSPQGPSLDKLLGEEPETQSSRAGPDETDVRSVGSNPRNLERPAQDEQVKSIGESPQSLAGERVVESGHIRESVAMATEGEKIEALTRLLQESFKVRHLHRLLVTKGYKEVADAVHEAVGMDQYSYEVVCELHRRGQINAQFFKNLKNERPDKEKKITDIEAAWLHEDETPSKPSPAGGVTEGETSPKRLSQRQAETPELPPDARILPETQSSSTRPGSFPGQVHAMSQDTSMPGSSV